MIFLKCTEQLKQDLFDPLRAGLQASKDSLLIKFAMVIALFGLLLRIALLFLAGNRLLSPLSGVSDQMRYLVLADSISHGRGFSYAGEPTAFRPPLYPLLLAGSHIVFGPYYLLAVRILQFLAGLATAYVCYRLASRHFGIEAGMIAGAIALTLPSLIFITAELQTECLAAFLTILFLHFLMDESGERKSAAAGMGLTSGLATLVRFNCAILPVIGAVVCFWFQRSWKRSAVVASLAALIVSPWIIRNALVFDGQELFSSQGGANLLEGVLTPEGRDERGEYKRLRDAVGWVHAEIEVNDPHRLLFPGEAQLDRQARTAALSAWGNLDWKTGMKLLAGKIIIFWLSTDQLVNVEHFSTAQRELRATGVIAYYGVLCLALVGWAKLYTSSKEAALIAGFYVIFVTAAHLPFVMNTRVRVPLVDPLIPVLAGGGLHVLADLLLRFRTFRLGLSEPQNQ